MDRARRDPAGQRAALRRRPAGVPEVAGGGVPGRPRFLIVKSNTDRANPWIPYPVSRMRLGTLAAGGRWSVRPLGHPPVNLSPGGALCGAAGVSTGGAWTPGSVAPTPTAAQARRIRTKLAVPRSRSGLTLTITAVLDGAICPLRVQVIDDAGRHLLDVAFERDHQRRHAPPQRQAARHLGPIGGGVDGCRRAGPTTASAPSVPRASRRRWPPAWARVARPRRRRPARPRGPTGRREAATAAAPAGAGRRRPRRRGRWRRAPATARTGNLPTAVSPASMIAEAPRSTALAASLTSARVGRGSSRIDSSTWVATMAGTPRARGRAQHGLLHARHVGERHLEAEVAAGDHHRVGGVEDLVEPGDRLGPFELGDERQRRARRATTATARAALDVGGRLHEAERHQIDAERQPERQVLGVLEGQRTRRQRHVRRVDALVLAEQPAVERRACGSSRRRCLRPPARCGRRRAAANRRPDRPRQLAVAGRTRGRRRRRSRRWRSRERRPRAGPAAARRPAGRCGSSARSGPA